MLVALGTLAVTVSLNPGGVMAAGEDRFANAYWPGKRESLSFAWADYLSKIPVPAMVEGGPARICFVRPHGWSWYGPAGEMVLANGGFSLDAPSTRALSASCRKSGRLSLEMLIAPAAATQRIPDARILTVAGAEGGDLLALTEKQGVLWLTARSGKAAAAAPVKVGNLAGGRPAFLALSYAAAGPGDRLVVRVDGRRAYSGDADLGKLGAWRDLLVLFGNSVDGKQPWRGRLAAVAMGSQAWSDVEAARRAEAVRKLFRTIYEPPAKDDVEAKLVETTSLPAKGIEVYPRMLVQYGYEVQRVVERLRSAPPPKGAKVWVYHYARLDHRNVPEVLERKKGEIYRLTLQKWSHAAGVQAAKDQRHDHPDCPLDDEPFFDATLNKDAAPAGALAWGGLKAEAATPSSSQPATVKGGVMLGGKFVPKEKFLVFFFFGDSNTWGTGFNWYQDDWRSDRLWNFHGGTHEWVPAQPAIIWMRQEPRAMGQEIKGVSAQKCVAWPFAKMLAQRYPDYHFGLVMAARGGGHFGTHPQKYEQHLGALRPYAGCFTVQGMVTELTDWGTKPFLKKFCEDFQADLGKLAIINNQRRVEMPCWHHPFYTPDMVSAPLLDRDRWKGPLGDMIGRDRFRIEYPRGATTSTEGLWPADHTHFIRHDIWAERAAYKLIAHGWATPDATPDTEKPGVPGNLRVVKTWDTGLKPAWDAAKDNLAVEGYEVFLDGKKVQWAPGMPDDTELVTTVFCEFPVTGLAPDREYTLQVRTVDYAGNRSPFSGSVKVRTSAKPPVLEKFPIRVNIGGPAVGDWLADKAYRDGEDYGYPLWRGAQNDRAAEPQAKAVFGDSPEAVVFSSGAGVVPFYRLRTPNGRHTATWFGLFSIKTEELGKIGWKWDTTSPLAAKLAGAAPIRKHQVLRAITREIEVTDGHLRVTWPLPGSPFIGQSSMQTVVALEVRPAQNRQAP